MTDRRRLHLLGVAVDPRVMAELHQELRAAIDERRTLNVVSQNLHGVYLYHQSARMRELHERSLVRIDGMSLVFIGRLLGLPLSRAHRITWVDWIDPLMSEAARSGWRVFYLGAKPDVLSRGIAQLRDRYPTLAIEGHHGYVTPEEAPRIRNIIADFRADIVLVGMGMPKQEEWLLANDDVLDAPVRLTCGAALEYVAGVSATAPRWLARIGLEWLHRLATNPRRFWRRYLLEPWVIARYLVRDVVNRFRTR